MLINNMALNSGGGGDLLLLNVKDVPEPASMTKLSVSKTLLIKRKNVASSSSESSLERSISIGSLFEDVKSLFRSDDKNLIMFSFSISLTHLPRNKQLA